MYYNLKLQCVKYFQEVYVWDKRLWDIIKNTCDLPHETSEFASYYS